MLLSSRYNSKQHPWRQEALQFNDSITPTAFRFIERRIGTTQFRFHPLGVSDVTPGKQPPGYTTVARRFSVSLETAHSRNNGALKPPSPKEQWQRRWLPDAKEA